MTENKDEAHLLNNLILINNDRVAGYQKAIKDLLDDDSDLKILFREKANQSIRLNLELSENVTKMGVKVETGTTNTGRIYRVWMDLKTLFGGATRRVILDNCESGEDAALLAYRRVLESDVLSPSVKAMITSHYGELKVSHDRIKALRDAERIE